MKKSIFDHFIEFIENCKIAILGIFNDFIKIDKMAILTFLSILTKSCIYTISSFYTILIFIVMSIKLRIIKGKKYQNYWKLSYFQPK